MCELAVQFRGILRSRDAGSLDVWLNAGIRKLGSSMPIPTGRVASKPCQTALNAALSATTQRLKQIDSLPVQGG
jgi:hypothetical protein